MNKSHEEELEQAIDDMNLADKEEVQESKSSEEVLLLKEEISDLTDKLLRNAAEAENLRKRYEKQLEEAKTYAIGNFAKDMISVLDNLSRALEHKPEEMSNEVKNILMGVEMTKTFLNTEFTQNLEEWRAKNLVKAKEAVAKIEKESFHR